MSDTRLKYTQRVERQILESTIFYPGNNSSHSIAPLRKHSATILMDNLVILLTVSFIFKRCMQELLKCVMEGLAAWFDWHVFNRAGAQNDDSVIAFIQRPRPTQSSNFDPPFPNGPSSLCFELPGNHGKNAGKAVPNQKRDDHCGRKCKETSFIIELLNSINKSKAYN